MIGILSNYLLKLQLFYVIIYHLAMD